jgi:hypothetical protein
MFVDETKSAMTTNIDPTIVLCVPGKWRDRAELAQLISAQSGSFGLSGDHLIEGQSKATIELQVETHDPRMEQAFRAVGPHWADADAMRKIDEHTLVAYLISRGGSHPRAITLMLAAATLLRAGGLGVKIESSGIAHSPETWMQLTDNRHLLSAHEAFIAYVNGDEIYTCGMHSFGLRDAVIAIGEADDPLELLRVFTWYLFTETPPIRPGQIFSVADGQPRYRLSEEECTQYGADELFKNQYGMWRLSRIVE